MDYVIIVAGGKGLRMGTDIPKQFLPIGGKPVLMRTLERFREYSADLQIILVLPKAQQDYWKELYQKYPFDKRVIRKLIRNEFDRTQPARLYDLDYDIQLNEALRILKEEDFKKLMAGSKTLKELEAEAEKEKATKENGK